MGYRIMGLEVNGVATSLVNMQKQTVHQIKQQKVTEAIEDPTKTIKGIQSATQKKSSFDIKI